MNFRCKNKLHCKIIFKQTRACTGFDGVLQSGEAICGKDRTVNRKLNINAEDNYALAA